MEETKKKSTKKEIKKEFKKPAAKKPGTGDKKVKGNPTGKYNMKFIDWTNEWEAVYDYMNDPEAKENPCGLSESEFESIVVYLVKIIETRSWLLL